MHGVCGRRRDETNGVSEALLARFQKLNPLDRLAYARDVARRRAGFPGAHIQFHIELDGPCDLDGFRRALRVVQVQYPAAAARLARRGGVGPAAWRFSDAPDAFTLHVHNLDAADPDSYQRMTESLLAMEVDYVRGSAVQFHMLRGLPEGDRIIVRWPHALTDAHGGAYLIERIEHAYEHDLRPEEAVTAGDELRRDYERLIERVSWGQRWRIVFDEWRRQRRTKWPSDNLRVADLGESGPVRTFLRTLSAQEAKRAHENSMRLCGFARFSDFVRACAVRAMHDFMPPPTGDYVTMQLIDHRKRREHAPVCHNLFSALPLTIPAAGAADIRKTADLVQAQTAEMVARGAALRQLVVMNALADLVMPVLSRFLFGQELSPQAPTLPLGFVAPVACRRIAGANVTNAYGTRAPMLRAGFGINVVVILEMINISASCFTSRISPAEMDAFLDAFKRNLIDPPEMPRQSS